MDDVIRRLKRFRDERNWRSLHTPKNLAMSISIEAGELLEIFQWKHETETVDLHTRARVGDEAADVMIYLFLLAETLGLDLIDEVKKKIDINEDRFPKLPHSDHDNPG